MERVVQPTACLTPMVAKRTVKSDATESRYSTARPITVPCGDWEHNSLSQDVGGGTCDSAQSPQGSVMYAKVFSQIFDSSIADDYKLRHFFIDMLLLADMNGIVEMTPRAISGRTGIPIEEVKTCLEKLESPDPDSRNHDHEGRRILKIDKERTWGWCITNYAYYRSLATEEQRRNGTRLRMQKMRSKGKSDVPVTQSDACYDKQKQMQKEKQRKDTTDPCLSASDSANYGSDPESSDLESPPAENNTVAGNKPLTGKELLEYQASEIYKCYPRKVARPKAVTAIIKQLRQYHYADLLKRVQMFAAKWEGADKEEMGYCPHPTTWFNQERFMDHPDTWGPRRKPQLRSSNL